MIINVHETLYETLTETFRIFFQKFFLAKQTRLFNCHPAKQDTVRVWATDGRVIMSAMKKKAGVPDFAQWALNRTQATTRPEPQREWIGLLVLFQLGVHAAAACRPSMIRASMTRPSMVQAQPPCIVLFPPSFFARRFISSNSEGIALRYVLTNKRLVDAQTLKGSRWCVSNFNQKTN